MAKAQAKACFPDAAALAALVSERHVQVMDEACASEAAAAILRALEAVCIS